MTASSAPGTRLRPPHDRADRWQADRDLDLRPVNASHPLAQRAPIDTSMIAGEVLGVRRRNIARFEAHVAKLAEFPRPTTCDFLGTSGNQGVRGLKRVGREVPGRDDDIRFRVVLRHEAAMLEVEVGEDLDLHLSFGCFPAGSREG